MRDFLASKNFSLACAIFNACFALSAFAGGNWMFGLLCSGFAVYCGNNYRRAL